MLNTTQITNATRMTLTSTIAPNGTALTSTGGIIHSLGTEVMNPSHLTNATATMISRISSNVTALTPNGSSTLLNDNARPTNMPLFIACCVLAGLLFLPGVFGNGMIILSVLKIRKLRTPTNYLIASLAVADILMMFIMVAWLSFILTPPERMLISYQVYRFLFASLDLLVGSASIINLAAVSLDRGMAVVRPLHYQSMVNHTRIRRIIMFIWFYSILVFILNMFRAATHSRMYQQIVLYIAYAGGFAIPFFIIMSSYTVILLSAVKSMKITRALEKAMSSAVNHGARNRTEEAQTRRRMRTREIKVGINIMVILIPFVLGWGFFFGTLWYEEVTQNFNPRPDLYEWFLTVIPWFNSSINPIIYICLTKALRKGCRQLLCKQNPYGRPRENSTFSRTLFFALSSKRTSLFERANSTGGGDKSPTFGRFNRRRSSSDGFRSNSFTSRKASMTSEFQFMRKVSNEGGKPASSCTAEMGLICVVNENNEESVAEC